MFKKSVYFITSLVVVFSMLAAASPAFALSRKLNVRGKVIALNKKTSIMTIKKSNGSKLALLFTGNTKLKIHGKSASVSSLHVGDQVSMNYTPTTGGNDDGTATDGQDNPGAYELHGTIAAVDTVANTVSIASEDGGSTVTLNVDSTTVIMRNGAPATISDLAFGDKVDAKYDSTTMLASFIDAESEVQKSEIEGTISALDPVAGTVTITPEEGGGPDVVLNTDPTTVFMLDDSPVTFADLQVGFQVEAKYDPSTMLASLVDAESH